MQQQQKKATSKFEKRKIKFVNGIRYIKDNWYEVINPILRHQSFKDENNNEYEYVDEAIVKQSNRIPPQLWNTWGQVMYHCVTDDSMWRIGFVHLDQHDDHTLPDPASCDSSHNLILIRVKEKNKQENEG